MNTQKRLLLFCAVAICLLLYPVLLLGGTTGKIAGTVIDSNTDDAVTGATVRIVGTDIVTQTDSDGDYFILNLPAGTYSVSISSVGFQDYEKENVRVLLDLTTPVDFDMEMVDVPLGHQVRVYAERPPIQKDLTASRSTMTAEHLIYTPNTITMQGIISNMAGTVIDRNNNLHVRGGRAGTVSYYYDGFSIQDPFVGNAGIRVMPDALEEINLTSGGFPAEYGEALSGIVNAVSQEGSQIYHGRLKFYNGFARQYDPRAGFYSSIKPIDNYSGSYNFSGPVPLLRGARSTFFMAGEYIKNEGSLPHNSRDQYSQTAKFKVQPSPNLRLTMTGSYFKSDGEVYDHADVNGLSYDLNLDGLGIVKSEGYLYGMKGNYNLNEKSIFSFSYNHFYTETKQAPEHLFDTYWDQWPGYSEDSLGRYNGWIDDSNYQAASEYHLTGFTYDDDYEPVYHKRYTAYDAVALTFTSQVNKHNQVSLGGEYRNYDIFWDDKQFYNANPYGEKYQHNPIYSMLFVQDKMELKDFIVNAGLRWDYLNSEVEYWPDVMNKNTPRIKSTSKHQISPRLGVSHPISENSLIRFNYGYFFQVPNYIFMYTNGEGDISTGLPLVGNPNLKAEKTIAYELGLNQMIGDDIRLDVTAYFKDIENLVATSEIDIYAGNPVTRFVNEDYGSVKGLDITIEKVARGNLFGSFVYSYMIANGNSSSAYEGYYNYIANTTDSVKPVQEYPLAFDQRHKATLSVNYRVPREWKGKLFGVPIPSAWGLSVAARYGSGLPYTLTNDLGQRFGSINGGRMPATYSMDVRFNKDIFVKRSDAFFSFFVEVTNLFDRLNTINVYTNTGRPDYNGQRYNDTVDPDGAGPLTVEDVNNYHRLIANDPQNFSAPRRVRVGLEFNF